MLYVITLCVQGAYIGWMAGQVQDYNGWDTGTFLLMVIVNAILVVACAAFRERGK